MVPTTSGATSSDQDGLYSLAGSWDLTECRGLEQFLVARGVPYFVRKMLAKMDKREKAEKQAPVGSSKYVPLTTMDDKKRI